MIKHILKILAILPLCALFQSCIKDPPLNPEADIETFEVGSQLLTAPTFIDQGNDVIMLYLTDSAVSHGIVPHITVSKGAKISPSSGDTLRFGKEESYTVTSESGEYHKIYKVQVFDLKNWTFNFENWTANGESGYEYPLQADGLQIWSSGNPGVAFSGVQGTYNFPTRSTQDHYEGSRAAELVTVKGNSLSEIMNIRLFAGAMFLGNFNTSKIVLAPLEATEFGQPFTGRAERFTGYYKYIPGANYQDRAGNILSGVSDSCSIYAVLYSGTERLNGTNIQTSDRIIAKAILKDGSAKAEWTRFDIAFEYLALPSQGPMMMAIVASSSHDGNEYKGAIGSRLVIDNLQIVR